MKTLTPTILDNTAQGRLNACLSEMMLNGLSVNDCSWGSDYNFNLNGRLMQFNVKCDNFNPFCEWENRATGLTKSV